MDSLAVLAAPPASWLSTVLPADGDGGGFASLVEQSQETLTPVAGPAVPPIMVQASPQPPPMPVSLDMGEPSVQLPVEVASAEVEPPPAEELEATSAEGPPDLQETAVGQPVPVVTLSPTVMPSLGPLAVAAPLSLEASSPGAEDADSSGASRPSVPLTPTTPALRASAAGAGDATGVPSTPDTPSPPPMQALPADLVPAPLPPVSLAPPEGTSAAALPLVAEAGSEVLRDLAGSRLPAQAEPGPAAPPGMDVEAQAAIPAITQLPVTPPAASFVASPPVAASAAGREDEPTPLPVGSSLLDDLPAEAPRAQPVPNASVAAEGGRVAAQPRDPLPAAPNGEVIAGQGAAPVIGDTRPIEVSRADAPASSAPPPPARQVAPIAIALAFAPALGQFNVALDPPQLGRVEIAVQREGDVHQVRVLAERPETLALLERDRSELDRALAEAGVAVGQGGISFGLTDDAGADGHPSDGREGEAGRSFRASPLGPAPASGSNPGPPAARGLLDLRI